MSSATILGEVELTERDSVPSHGRLLDTRPHPPIPVLKLRVRDTDGRLVQVHYRGEMPGHVDLGDRVKVTGRFIQGVLRADRIYNETTESWVTDRPCFIASAVVARDAPEAVALRQFRDSVLLASPFGARCVALYERWSPPVARAIRDQPVARWLARQLLVRPAAAVVAVGWELGDRTKAGDKTNSSEDPNRENIRKVLNSNSKFQIKGQGHAVSPTGLDRQDD